MFDIEAITNRAQAAAARAAEGMKELQEKSERLIEQAATAFPKEESAGAGDRTEGPAAAGEARQVELLGQVFSPEIMARMALNQEALQQQIQEEAALAAASGVDAIMRQVLGEDMGVLSAALETLAMEEDGEDEEEPDLDLEREEALCTLLEETMARIEALPEPEPVLYGKDADRWARFGILLSGIVSTINRHSLDGMDVEPHIPVMEQQVVSIVRRSWGIDGRSDLLDMIRYLSQEGYLFRYRLYSEAVSPEELLDEDADEEERESTARAWRFAQRYKSRYAPGFLAGWDVGRAAMLTRWGCYLGWITQGEAVGILWELSQKAAEELHSWREFAQSYLFGGLMWKLLCGDSAAASYLGYLADAATDLLTSKPEGGQWRDFPWPAPRKIGFAVE